MQPGPAPADGRPGGAGTWLLQDEERIHIDARVGAATDNNDLDAVRAGAAERELVGDLAERRGRAVGREGALQDTVDVDLELAARRRSGRHEAKRAHARALEGRRSAGCGRVQGGRARE